MVLLPKIQEAAIVDNLKKRYMDDLIFVSFFNTAKLYKSMQCGVRRSWRELHLVYPVLTPYAYFYKLVTVFLFRFHMSSNFAYIL